MTKYMKVKDSWPIRSIGNTLFSCSKTEPCPVPEGYKPNPKVFDVFDTAKDAQAAVSKPPKKIETRKDEAKGITRVASVEGEKKPEPHKEEEAPKEPQAEFHGLRKVTDVKDGSQYFMVATKDIPRFLNRESLEIAKDVRKLDDDSLNRIRSMEVNNRKRQAVLESIDKQLGMAEEKSEPIEPEQEEEPEEDEEPEEPEEDSKSDGKKTKQVGPKSDLKRLLNIKGIGPKTVEDLKRICTTVDELRELLIEDAVPIRDDQVELLEEVLL